jgi:hypothetical protein
VAIQQPDIEKEGILVTWFEAGTVNVFKKEDTSLRKANKECSEVRLSKPCFA